ncbi:MAG: hypothetical protein NUK57_03050 [Gudongella sp.]|nr:hypothetical protein [Gudongella sp.]
MRKIMAIIVFLSIALGVFLFMGRGNSDIIVYIDDMQTVVEREDILAMSNGISFPAVVRSSGSKPVETEYTGVWIMDFLKHLGIEGDFDTITFNASDGYRVMLSGEELKEPGNVYLAYMRDGEDLKSRERGGNGPYQLVIRSDPFSQRWIKHVDEMRID